MDTEFEDMVADSLQQESASVRIPAGLTDLAKRARRRHRRRRQLALRGGLTAGIAVGTAAAVVVAFGASAPHAPGLKLRAQMAAYIVRRTGNALANDTAGTIQYTRQTGSAAILGTDRSATAFWSYGRRSVAIFYGADGSPVLANDLRRLNVQPPGTVNLTQVDYASRTWWRVTTAGPAVVRALPPPKRCEANPPALPGLDLSIQWIRYYLECGLFVVAGRQHVDGVDATKIVPSKRPRFVGEVFWINPATYLPVRSLLYSLSHTFRWWQQLDLEWLPPTPANLARLTVPIPAGFRRVTSPFPPD